MRSPLSQNLLLLLTYTLFTSAREIDLHIDLGSPKAYHHETPFPNPQQVPDHHANLDFDSLKEGALVGNHGFLTWTDNIRVSCAGSLASSKPNAVLISQYNADNQLTYPGFRIDNTTATFDTFDLLSFYVAPAYEPSKDPPLTFNFRVSGRGGAGSQPDRALSHTVTICGPDWPQKIELEDFKEVASVTVEMTSQIAPTGGPFMPSFLLDDVHIFWRRAVHGEGDL